MLILLVAVIMFAAGVAVTWWYLTQRPVTTTTNVPSPAPDFGPLTPGTLAATPEPVATAEAVVAEAAPTLPAAPPAAQAGAKAAPPPARRATKPPVVPPGPAGPAASQPGGGIGSMGATRSFVLGTTVVESLRPVGRDLQGFDTSGIGVKRAPKVEGQLELVMQPPKVESGRPYLVMVFLKNDGKKPIEVDEMKVSMIVDGKWSTRPLPPKVKQVAPKRRVLLEELPGIWRPDVSDWAVEAVVTSKSQDVYRNRLTWK
jgi:archaellum component FlaG (FlaF/FlaG flagellin family)